MPPEPQKVVRHLIELVGGPYKAFAAFDDDFRIMSERWDQDTVTIGRILRSHLFVEHFLTEFLTAQNAELGSVAEARLTFAQKLALIGEGTAGVTYLIPGIRRLNTIRNRLAHTLSADVSADDTNVFLGVTLFKAMRDEGAKPGKSSSDPVVILEDFARHAGIALHASATRNAEIWAEAFRLAEEEERQQYDGAAT